MDHQPPKPMRTLCQHIKNQKKLDQALLESAKKGNNKACKLLLISGASCNPDNNKLLTPLRAAVSSKDLTTIDLLLKAGAEVRYKKMHNGSLTPLFYASVYSKDLRLIGMLLKYSGDQNPKSIAHETDNNALLHNVVQTTLDYILEGIFLALVRPLSDDQIKKLDTEIREAFKENIAIYSLLIRLPRGLPTIERERLKTVLLIRSRKNNLLAHLPKNLLLEHIFPYLWPNIPFTQSQIPRCINQKLEILSIKNNKNQTAYDIAHQILKCKSYNILPFVEGLETVCILLNPNNSHNHIPYITNYFSNLHP